MKIPTLVIVAALACGAAVAQTSNSTAAATDSQSRASNGGLVDKTKNAFHRLGDATRNTWNRIAHRGRKSTDRDDAADSASRSDTRSMGASGSNTTDHSRRTRMDQAYDNWKSKQK